MAFAITVLFFFTFGCASTPTPKRGPLNLELVADGVYEGSATVWPVKAVVKVAIANKLIPRIDILEHRTMLGKPAWECLTWRI